MAADWVALTKQIKEANDIVSVVGSYLSLQPRGGRYVAICPFHSDTRPSLDVDSNRQRYKCWACGAFGDVFKFVMLQEKVDFKEARALLARKAGISLEEDAKLDHHRIRMQECLRWAQQQYEQLLFDGEEAEAARVYLGERRLNGSTVRSFGLGFAPGYGDWIVRRSRTAQIDAKTLVDVGLIAQRNDGNGFYDRFRDRIIFPIRDARGQTVGFGGRILPSSPNPNNLPKYYNSTETALFNKSELLFGLDTARHVAAKTGTIAIVEGYTDVMMAHQFGIGNVVATMGTALNTRHLTQLRRYLPKEVKVILVFDADAGGKTGIDRALEIFVGNDLELLIATLPESLDPCDLLIQPGGREAFERVLAEAIDALDFKMNELLKVETFSTVEGKRRIADTLLRIMVAAPETSETSIRMKQDLIVHRISQRLGLMVDTLRSRLQELREQKKTTNRPRETTDRYHEEEAKSIRVAPAPPLEIELLEILLADASLIPDARITIHPDDVDHPGLKKLLACLYRLHDEGLPADEDGLRLYIDNPALIDRALDLQEVGKSNPDTGGWLKRISAEFAARKNERISRDIKEQIHSAQDETAAMELLRKLQTRSAVIGSAEPSTAETT
ncbi:DNA primase [Telmatocola sphagniphila]|uniref:DNA primase n=1 Tax=Telmatocola sphagniphila TaxID=1123043 RepID=A0A8E6ETZ8_9BACT|nr:DNA primase [Telmatocola sphagniphila]QVL33064.1 DNA primase [Telmatocola sphagniphila]